MPGLWLRSLSGRFLMVAALLLVTFSVTMTALAAHQEATALYGELERTARGTGQLLEPSAINWVLRGDISDLEHALRVVRSQDGVVDAYIMDDAGQVLADGTGRGPGRVELTGARSAEALAAGRAGVLRHGPVLDAINPLETSGERLGTLIIGYDLTEAERTIQDSRERHLLTGLAFAVLGLIVTWLLIRGVTRRLLLLTHAAQAAAGEQLPRLVRGLRAGGDPADLAPPPSRSSPPTRWAGWRVPSTPIARWSSTWPPTSRPWSTAATPACEVRSMAHRSAWRSPLPAASCSR